MAYWLMKSEPDAFSIDALAQRPGQTEHWDGVRNYQARNFLRAMRRGDQAFFYHSNCAEPGIVGIVDIAREAYPDHTALDPDHPHYDPKSRPETPRWFMVDVKLRRKLARRITLAGMKQHPELSALPLARRGNRLSVMPVDARAWRLILEME